ncbi:MAG: hypothetical protein IIZ73_04205 [Ruminococcus sp.]|nr:hypothetical protein [Ruminococcus sp.]
MREINCLRCGVPMKHYLTERIQLGGESIFLPHLDNLLSGYLPVSIMKCPKCRKLEFFLCRDTKKRKKRQGISE